MFGMAEKKARIILNPDARGYTLSPYLFGINTEVTRKGFFGGLSAQMLNNRKFYAGKDGPDGWECRESEYITDRPEDSLCSSHYVILRAGGSASQTSGVIALEKNRRYEAKAWVRTLCGTTHVTLTAERHSEEFSVAADGELFRELSLCFSSEETKNGTFTVQTDADIALFEVSLMPADAFYGMRRDVIGLLRAIGPTAIRFPGGCSADHFQWRESLKAPEFRKPVSAGDKWFLFPDTYDQDCEDIGLNEFAALCREIGAEPEFTVSMLLSDAEDARCLVEYCNGMADTPYGAIRESLGCGPMGIRLWYIRNEVYFFGGPYREDPIAAADKTNEMVKAMMGEDPGIQAVVGVTWPEGFQQWSKDFTSHLDCRYAYLSYHNYAGLVIDQSQGDNGRATCPMIERLFKDGTDAGLEFYRLGLFPLDRENARVCADEWNYNWGMESSNALFLSNALQFHFLAKCGERYRVDRAAFFMPVNEGMITVRGKECRLESTGEFFRLMARHGGGTVIPCTSNCPDLDLLCTLRGDLFTISIVNRSAQPYEIELGACKTESCVQLKTGEYSFSSNEHELIENSDPIIYGHSAMIISFMWPKGS